MVTFFYALTAILCALCLTGCIFVAQRAGAEQESLRKRLRSCELQTESNRNSLEETQQTLTDIANRVKMQTVRKAAHHAAGSSGEPDPYRDPDGWRSMMSRRIALAKTGVKQ
jgi:hypothetical protein